jgi:type I restriction enzyme, S subunit
MNKEKHNVNTESWNSYTVSEVFDFLPSNSFSRSQLDYSVVENCIYNIHYGDIHATYKEPLLDFQKENKIPIILPDVELPNSLTFLEEGDVIMADASEDYKGVGEVIELKNIGDKKVVAGLHTFALRDNSGLTINGFRTYIFKHPTVSRAVKVIATGSKVYGISKRNFANIKLIIPPLIEQKKIATILTTCDKVTDVLTQLIAAKIELKKGLMQQLITGKKRFDGFTEKWQYFLVQDLVENGVIAKPMDGNHGDIHPKSEDFVELGIPFIMANDIKDESLDLNNCKKILKDQADKLQKGYSYKGDVLLTHKGSVGNTAIVGEISTPYLMLTPQVTFYRIIKYEELLPKYLKYYFQSEKFQNILTRLSGGGTRAYIGITAQRKLPIVIPNIQEQVKITSVLSAIDKEIEKLKNQLVAMNEQKKGLIKMLLTGKKRII